MNKVTFWGITGKPQVFVMPSKGLKKFKPRKRLYRVDLLKDGQPKVFRCSASNPLEARNKAIAHFGEAFLFITNTYQD